MLVVFAVILFDRVRIDDPVGALSVHLVCGVWGTLAVGLFAAKPFAGGDAAPLVGLLYGGGFKPVWNQLVGIASVGVFVMATSSIVWFVLKTTMGIRVTEEEEIIGLDLSEMGMEAYPKDTYVPGNPTSHTPMAMHEPEARRELVGTPAESLK